VRTADYENALPLFSSLRDTGQRKFMQSDILRTYLGWLRVIQVPKTLVYSPTSESRGSNYVSCIVSRVRLVLDATANIILISTYALDNFYTDAYRSRVPSR